MCKAECTRLEGHYSPTTTRATCKVECTRFEGHYSPTTTRATARLGTISAPQAARRCRENRAARRSPLRWIPYMLKLGMIQALGGAQWMGHATARQRALRRSPVGALR